MQSPPISAEATNVSIWSPTFAPTRRFSQVNVVVHQLTQTQVLGQSDRQKQSGVGHQAVIIEGDMDAVGLAGW